MCVRFVPLYYILVLFFFRRWVCWIDAPQSFVSCLRPPSSLPWLLSPILSSLLVPPPLAAPREADDGRRCIAIHVGGLPYVAVAACISQDLTFLKNHVDKHQIKQARDFFSRTPLHTKGLLHKIRDFCTPRNLRLNFPNDLSPNQSPVIAIILSSSPYTQVCLVICLFHCFFYSFSMSAWPPRNIFIFFLVISLDMSSKSHLLATNELCAQLFSLCAGFYCTASCVMHIFLPSFAIIWSTSALIMPGIAFCQYPQRRKHICILVWENVRFTRCQRYEFKP